MFFNQSCQSYNFILIIDNDPNNQCTLSNILQLNGIKVKKTISGKTSIQVAKQELPDLILLDINTPEINGYEVYQQLKTQIETANIPIIFISTPEQTLAKIMSFNIGRVDYTEKNFQESEVLAPIKNKSLFWQQNQGMINQNQGLWQESWESRKTKQIIKAETLVDELTGIANRRKFDEYFNLEWRRLCRKNLPLSLLLCNVDFFKSYNNTYGYLSGDSCLQQIAKTIKLSVKRSTDLLARYQEEKFAIILSNTEFGGAVYLAELIRKEVYNLKIPHTQSKIDEFITLSIGLATILPKQNVLPNTFIEMVEKALDEAKIHGGDLIIARKII
ncbi:diguanylate cyclase [Anabaena cylindrica FACHB-243]|uniref:Response regulator receiver modulated diguanylate cyclase n=2 Tax=Nostocaceae TaxID=1162 RepID=K9ZHP6_ANACC|nr:MULTISPECIES: diguanylate cyclase [Anabaena]AFZ58753.1 response regulator receiver modulated diguanylate cyclase [Anabaena cylindrica PCC 7122]MBD2420095.1 diguanylate cyclase [Anabaena cylindrica FACHB-243]MBY5285392.1 diguanylate cyclase [Anabaena sp. CCAP 1446/1C]MBY5306567.1 diguanylate cyclase [Anabaena sp. CCAP 1446/1C]BAY04236.1 response regulator receiver modulated diguanylate cyclase [Anabaena cylindrica PCC 7122]